MKIGLLSGWQSPILGHVIESLLDRGIAVDAVLLDAKPPNAKDTALWQERTGGRLPPVPLERFETRALPFYLVANHSSPTTVQLVRHLGLDLLVNAGTPRILSAEILAAPRIGVLNVHPGLLPEFRGCTCVEWAIHLDEPIGNTAHFMSTDIDEGPVVMRRAYAFSSTDNYASVRCRVYREGFVLMAEAIQRIQDEGLTPATALPQAQGRYFKPIDDRRLNEIKIKLNNGNYKYQLENPP